MTDRVFAIISTDRAYDANVAATIGFLKAVPDSEVVLFSDVAAVGGVEAVVFPTEADTEPKRRNWINSRYAESGFSGFLHVIADSTELLKDPLVFVADLEKMMKVLDYGLWLNTACDPLNLVYSKHTPNLTVNIDHEDVTSATGLTGSIHVTSHSNTQWVSYDFAQLKDSDLLKFDEDFTVAMFYIVELLSRRRNTAPKGSLYFMNQYLTVGSEPGTFRKLDLNAPPKDESEAMKRENDIWQSKKVNFRPDYNTDMLLERLWEKLSAKSGLQAV